MHTGSKKVLEKLFEQKKDGMFCDVQLYFQNSIIWCHACVLASCSTFFMDYLKTGINKNNHWCHRKPLVIVLDKVVDDVNDTCFICVSTIIDFMYLREIVVSKEHLKHFHKIVNFLRVLDLLPLCRKKFQEENSTNSLNPDIVSERHSPNVILNLPISKISSEILLGKNNLQLSSKENKSQVNEIKENKSHVNERNKIFVASEKVKSQHINGDIYKRQETVQNLESTKKSSTNVSFKDNCEQKQITSSIKNCEFLCCNPDIKLQESQGCGAKIHRKRALSCKSCQYTSISIKKMLKHVQKMNHVEEFCPVCNLKEENIERLKEHLQLHDHSKPFICQVCQKRNRFWEVHNLHLKVHCKNKQFHCEICQRRFKYLRNLTNHVKTHNYVCNKCGYLSSEEKSYQLHQIQHNNDPSALRSAIVKTEEEQLGSVNQIKSQVLQKFEVIRNFQCSVCSKRFTMQKNLARHTELKHQSSQEFNCSICNYVTKRFDTLRYHMKRHHNCLPPKTEKTKLKSRMKVSEVKGKQARTNKSGILGVLIPVQLMPADGNATINAFAVKVDSSGKGISTDNNKDVYNSNSNKITDNMHSGNDTIFQSQTSQRTFNAFQESKKEKLQDFIGQPKISLNIEDCKSEGKFICCNELKNIHSDEGKENVWNCETRQIGSHLIEQSENIWLNEATGELLSGKGLLSVPKIDIECNVDQNNCIGIQTEMSSNFEDPLHSLMLSDPGGNLSAFDFDDDKHSNPQTPQTNFVDFDGQDTFFPWESLTDNFCSTWVLNETTGELDMVRFGIQTFKNYDELKLDENTGTFSLIEDDDTALFLNEGTGDLSVIYFNPNKNYCDTPNYFFNDQLNQEKLETMSQHSNEEDDILNEEFLLASANFMARDENETFLNELTGEFDVANYNNLNSETHKTVGNESIYLNEETGEMSRNIVDQNMNNDILPNPETLGFDFDDSLNCEDFEQFSTEVNDFSSQFCIDNSSSNDWHNFDETRDTLLNECTGELVKRC